MNLSAGAGPSRHDPSKGLSLRTNFSWTAIGNIVYAACQWGVVIILANLGTAQMVGQFAFALAITGPIVQFFNMHLRSVQATDARREFQFSSYFTLRTVTTLVAILVCVLVATVSGFPFDTVTIIVLVSLSKALDAFSDVFYGMFQQHEQMDLISRALIVNGLLSLLLLAGGIWLTGSLIVGVTGYALASLITLAIVILPTRRRFYRNRAPDTATLVEWRPDELSQLARIALPLGVTMLIVSLNTNIPRYFLQSVVGENGLGIFAALAYLIMAGTTVVSSLGQAVSPRLAHYYATGRLTQFRRMMFRLIAFGLTLGLLGTTIALIGGRQILTFIYTPEYAGYNNVLVILTIAAGITFAASFAGYGMTATRTFVVQVPLFITVLLVATVSSWLLIPEMGLIGAGYVMCLTSGIQLMGSIIVIRRALKRRELKG